ncbi:serine/threonine kinase [Hypoxylon rubiginosum]|uniref:Serine/threonine kinase n=1 Tax=Hypoxylon rubiginosum TaxID=110542 RepID=A0ACB9YV84_9PEZI|nr:serine/threonine kinase [Hypoxylon rubiginosum]
MEICEQSEAFVEKDGDLVFEHTKIILRRQEDEYFYATTEQRLSTSSKIDVNSLHLINIPTDNIWPTFDTKLTRAPDPLPPNSYVKQPSFLYYDDAVASSELSGLLLNEAEVCETLRRHPHPNIARYLGCIVKDGRIRGLCFVKYSMTLPQRLKHAPSFDKGLCLQGIARGVTHLHELGLIHNDLNPSNIMMDGDNPVIIDFDSCKREQERLGPKAGTEGWEIEGSGFARRENDIYGLSKIREYLIGSEGNGDNLRST